MHIPRFSSVERVHSTTSSEGRNDEIQRHFFTNRFVYVYTTIRRNGKEETRASKRQSWKRWIRQFAKMKRPKPNHHTITHHVDHRYLNPFYTS